MSTSYVFTNVNLRNKVTLYIDGNSKITVGNGTYDNPVPNALSLPHISTCPGATDSCIKSCYVYGLQKNAPDVYSKYCQNERAIHRLLMSSDSGAVELADWISKNCPNGFRWHVSGDIMNDRHASWIVDVASYSKEVMHWIYTRSISLVPLLSNSQNLTVNISADKDNWEEAKNMADIYGVRLCYFTNDGFVPEDLPEGSVIFPDYSLRGRDLDKPTSHNWWQGLSQVHRKMVCPADFFGQSEQHRCGACDKCFINIRRDSFTESPLFV